MTTELAIVLLALIGSITILGITYIGFKYLTDTEEAELIARYGEHDDEVL